VFPIAVQLVDRACRVYGGDAVVVKLVVVVAVGVRLNIDIPPMAKLRIEINVLKIGWYSISIKLVVQGAGGVVRQQEPISELSNLSSRRALCVWRIAPQLKPATERNQGRPIREFVPVFE